MRAVLYTRGGGTRVVPLAAWVLVAPTVRGGGVTVRCDRCGADEELGEFERAQAERVLGRFAVRHGKCPDREGRQELVDRWLERQKARHEGAPVPITYVRRRG